MNSAGEGIAGALPFDLLRLPAPETEAAERFCREFGFSPADDGRAWEKDIGYDPEFLGT